MKFLTAPSWTLSIFLIATFQRLQHVSAQPGFLSLDCGAPAPYVGDIGISWVPDDAYISGGKTGSTVTAAVSTDLKTLRYFPDTTRTRYCYNLPTTKGQNYLLRAISYHGSYDTHPAVQFDVALDIFQAKQTFNFTAEINFQHVEVIFHAFKDNIQLCLFRLLATDNPFISTIELRPLDQTMYATVTTGCSALLLQGRCNLGASAFLRYPDDKYDRFWPIGPSVGGFVNITSSSVADSGYAVDKPPAAVMNTAVTIPPIYSSLWYTLTPSTGKNHSDFLINIFLAELNITAAPGRNFDILVNGAVVMANVNAFSTALNEVYKPIEISNNMSTVDAAGILNISLSKTALSSAPPIWNAFEVFSVHVKQAGTLASDVTAIEGLKKAFGLGSLWTGDPCLLLPYDWLTCSADSAPSRVTAIKLSSANLSGPIPDLRALTSLTTLHLDDNDLTGPIPDWLASLPNLQELYLQNNNLSGNVPKSLLRLKSIRLEGNPGLNCLNPTCTTAGKKSSNVGIIVGVVVGVLVVVGIAIGAVCCSIKAKKLISPPLSQIAMEAGTKSRGCRYTLAQVMAATQKNAKILGKGGFGPVYYGKLASGQEVAVKVAAKGSGQGSKEFINEVELLTRIHHKNLLSLVGYCDEGDNLILLYEYMPLGTVQAHLYGVGEQKKEAFLDWKTRLQIALNSAQGLEYLHVGCNPVIFHRDVKSNNILLDDKLIAKVADFGLSKSTNSKENVTHMSTLVKGTIGYLDPEYFSSNQLTDKSDVFAFGIVLLELICGRPPIFVQLPDQDPLRLDQWVRPFLQAGTIEEIVDLALAGQYNLESMWRVVDLAMQSVEPKRKHRPNMSTIVHELRAAIEMENPNSSSNNLRFDTIPNSNASTVSDPSYVSVISDTDTGSRRDFQSSYNSKDSVFGTLAETFGNNSQNHLLTTLLGTDP